MSSPQNVPPWLREQLQKLQMTQQNLQTILAQKQQIEIERAEIDKALEELGKVSDTDAVYKHAGSILVKSTKSASTDDLTERRELSKSLQVLLCHLQLLKLLSEPWWHVLRRGHAKTLYMISYMSSDFSQTRKSPKSEFTFALR